MNIWQVSTICFFLTTVLWFGESHKESDLNYVLTNELNNCKGIQQKLTNSLNLTFKLDSICDLTQSSRNNKQNCKECLELATEINFNN